MKKLSNSEAKNGYIPYFGFNPKWREQKAICGYEHCIELMPLQTETNKNSCHIFGHNCPGGAEMVQKCLVDEVPKERTVK